MEEEESWGDSNAETLLPVGWRSASRSATRSFDYLFLVYTSLSGQVGSHWPIYKTALLAFQNGYDARLKILFQASSLRGRARKFSKSDILDTSGAPVTDTSDARGTLEACDTIDTPGNTRHIRRTRHARPATPDTSDARDTLDTRRCPTRATRSINATYPTYTAHPAHPTHTTRPTHPT